jgi:hypothetical protein
MTNRLSCLVAAALIAGLVASDASAASGKSRHRIRVPSVPPSLEVPAGNVVFLEGRATGTQNYICLPAGDGFAWKFLGPQATLFLPGFPQQITTHFLSANPQEGGTARATWQHSFDSSQVWARAIVVVDDPAVVGPGAIPWLLVQAVGRAEGPLGGSALARTTYIQRVNTSGGVAPETGCSAAGNVGAFALVPYTTDYFFYRARPKP